MDEVSAAKDAIEAGLGIACECVSRRIIETILLLITWGLITFDVVTDWLTWAEYKDFLGIHGTQVRNYTYAFLGIAALGSLFWILETVLIGHRIHQLLKELREVEPRRISVAEASENGGNTESDRPIMKEVQTRDKARLLLNCCIALLEDTPAIVINVFLLYEDVCFLEARNGLLTMATLISVLASTINSFWSLISSYITMCKCCCNSEGHCRLIYYGQCCPCCIKLEGEGRMFSICCYCILYLFWILLWPYALIFCCLHCIFSYATNEITINVKRSMCYRYIANIFIFTIFMANVCLGLMFYVLASVQGSTVLANNRFSQGFSGQMMQPGVDEHADGRIYLNHKITTESKFMASIKKDSNQHQLCYFNELFNRLYLGKIKTLKEKWPEKLQVVIPCEEAFPYYKEMSDMWSFSYQGLSRCNFIAEVQFIPGNENILRHTGTMNALNISAGIQTFSDGVCNGINIEVDNQYVNDDIRWKVPFDILKYRKYIDVDMEQYTCSSICQSQMADSVNGSFCEDNQCLVHLYSNVSSAVNAFADNWLSTTIHELEVNPYCSITTVWNKLPLCNNEYITLGATIKRPHHSNGLNYTKFMFSPKQGSRFIQKVDVIFASFDILATEYAAPECQNETSVS